MRNTLTCLLLLAATGTTPVVHAARSPEHREAQRQQQQQIQQQQLSDPYLILPPGGLLGEDVGSGGGRLARDLGERTLNLRHIYHHGSAKYPKLHRYIDIPKDAGELQVTYDYGTTYETAPRDLKVRVSTTNIQRLTNRRRSALDKIFDYAALHGEAMPLPASSWTVDEVAGPNITDKETILTFARVALNAYQLKEGEGDWQDIGGGYNYTDDFGWQADGLRGHIFADEHNKTVVIGLKGTSPAVFDGVDTTGNDKLNDNLFGSCCCGQGGQLLWKQVCDCMTSAFTCNNTCLVKSLREKGHYYWAVRDLYHNVTERYPNSDVWISGHSLGGVVSSMLGLTYGLPTITYEAFPDALAASRLGLPTPPGYHIGSHQARADTGIHHIGHTADPIFMGTCNSGTSFCTIAGYAFQGVCHTGSTCVYDTVGDLGWRVGIGTHKISNVIHDVLKKYDHVPACTTDTDCLDCFNWKFFNSNGSEPITSTTSSSSSTSPTKTSTRTRTETCKTPGWWGCLDESTTTSAPTTSTVARTSTTILTTTITTTTCLNPGWFGCKDPIITTTLASTLTKPITTTRTLSSPATTSATTTTTTSTTSTSTCKTPGWFGGCDDASATTATPAPSLTGSASATTTPTTSKTSTSTCTSAEWFGLICVDPSPTVTTTSPGVAAVVTGQKKKDL